MSIQTIGCDVRGFCVPSVGDWNQESGRFLVEERIVKIAKLKTMFLEDFKKKLVVEIFYESWLVQFSHTAFILFM